VGRFPEGSSREGAADMGGNAWEWTASWYDAGQTERVVRGGAWYDNRRYARCALPRQERARQLL